MSDHVSRKMAERLRGAGWKEPTHFIFLDSILSCVGRESTFGVERLPAPSIGELLDVVSYRDLEAYYHANVEPRFGDEFPEWIYETCKRPNALAEVWLWAQTQKKGEA